MSVAQRLAQLGIKLPSAPAPVAAYRPAIFSGGHVYVSGQLPFLDGELAATGAVGAEVTLEAAVRAARICAINTLAAIETVTDLERVEQIVKVGGYVTSAPGFTAQPAVIDGASKFYAEVFGEAGIHARAAVGVYQLPLGAAVEVDLVARLSQ